MDSPDEEECPICFETLRDVSVTEVWPCRHRFCSQCLSRQLCREAKCAICRRVYTETVPPLFLPSTSDIRTFPLSKGKGASSFGLTLGTRRDGRVIVRRVRWSHFFAGLTSQSVIVGVNSIPCRSTDAILHVLRADGLQYVLLHVRR